MSEHKPKPDSTEPLDSRLIQQLVEALIIRPGVSNVDTVRPNLKTELLKGITAPKIPKHKAVL